MPATELVTLIAVAGVLVIGVASSFARRIGVAAPLVLVVIGIGLGAIPGAPEATHVDPELILAVVLPPLLFAAARKVPFVDFQRNLRVILVLAIGLVALSAALVGVLVHLAWAAVPLALAIALGAVVAPPDAVAATSLGKRIGLPPRIVTILEGEGLINDATALVLLSTAVGIATATVTPNVWSVGGGFVWAVLGAVVIGGALGMLAVSVRTRIRDGVLDQAIAIVLPFLAYIGAELVGASGVVAVVTAGIVVGNSGAFRLSAAARRTENSTWQLAVMLLENAVFLYMGLQLWPVVREVADGPESLPVVLGLALLVTLLLVALRFALVPVLLWTIRRRVRRTTERYQQGKDRMDQVDERIAAGPPTDQDRERMLSQLTPERRAKVEKQWARRATRGDEGEQRATFLRRIERMRVWVERTGNDLSWERDQALGWRDGVILGMSGMRGVVTVAAVQTLPDGETKPALVLIAYAVAIVTLLAQGLTLPAVVRRLRPAADASVDTRKEVAELRTRIQEAGDEEVTRRVAERGDVPQEVIDEVRSASETRTERWTVWGTTDGSDPQSAVAIFADLRRRELTAERNALRDLQLTAGFSSEATEAVAAALDSEELQLEAYYSDED